jgi:hypothetical protein
MRRAAWGIRGSILGLAILLTAQTAAAQTAETQQVMREKLARSSAVLGALVTSNWAALERESRALEQLTARPGWQVLRFPEYARDTQAFVRAVQAVAESAGRRDLTTSLSAHNRLVASCVECHRNVALRRLATLR